ncbi:MAG TPA: PRC-barrel domain-containing protein [Bacteroidales bacterium]|nr:PRC-barrel domain-containing protein [Bacteroidales bacterium]
MKSLINSKIEAIDGEIGKLDDFYFDDRSWGIRYMVADTAKWIEGRKVLLSPVVVQEPDIPYKHIPVKLTKQQIQNSPDIDTKKPVSRQYEVEFSEQYFWPAYGLTEFDLPSMDNEDLIHEKDTSLSSGDPHLRSINEVLQYNIGALDGDIGHVDDVLLDTESWTIHFWVVKTRNWLPGKKVLISPHWINLISWEDKKVFVDVPAETIRNSPEYDPDKPMQAEYEEELNHYYGSARMNS